MKVFYKEHALAYPDHCFRTCGGPESFASTTFFLEMMCASSSVGHGSYILKAQLDLLYPVSLYVYVHIDMYLQM